MLCADCQSEMKFQGCLGPSIEAAFWYRGGLVDWLRDIKEGRRPERLREILPFLPPAPQDLDVLVAAASDPTSRARRLFDTSDAFAQLLSKHWGIPLLKNFFERRPFLSAQKNLKFGDRKSYLKKLVKISDRYKGVKLGRILLVDDVYTTGATIEVHQGLLKPLASEIRIFCLLRAPAIS